MGNTCSHCSAQCNIFFHLFLSVLWPLYKLLLKTNFETCHTCYISARQTKTVHFCCYSMKAHKLKAAWVSFRISMSISKNFKISPKGCTLNYKHFCIFTAANCKSEWHWLLTHQFRQETWSGHLTNLHQSLYAY